MLVPAAAVVRVMTRSPSSECCAAAGRRRRPTARGRESGGRSASTAPFGQATRPCCGCAAAAAALPWRGFAGRGGVLRASIATTSGETDPASSVTRIPAMTCAWRHPPVQQQDLDQQPGPGLVAVLGAGGGPERVVGGGEPALLPRVDQRGRPAQRAGFAGQDLEVVVEHQVLPALGGQPRVAGDLGGPVQHDQLLASSFARTVCPINRAGTE